MAPSPSREEDPEETPGDGGGSSDFGAILQTAYTSAGGRSGGVRNSQDEPRPSTSDLPVDDGATTAPASPRGQLFADDSSTDDDETAGVVPDPTAQVMGPLYVDTSLPGRYFLNAAWIVISFKN